MLNPSRLVRLFATGLVIGALAAITTSCVPPEGADAEEPEAKPAETKPAPPPSEDIVIDDLAEIELTGQLLAPEGMGSPGMARVKTDSRNLTRQRRLFARAKGAKKVDEARVLATLLWVEAAQKAMTDPEAEAALREETRQALRDASSATEETDAVLLQMLFAVEWRLGDKAAAMEAGTALLANHPTSTVTKAMEPWVAYGLLTEWNNEAAYEITKSWDLAGEGISYTHAYVAAWSSFRQGESEKARQALLQAARMWRSKTTRPAVEQEISVFMARTGGTVDDTVAAIMEFAQDPTTQYYWLYQTNEEFAKVGRFSEASEILDTAKELVGQEMKPSDLVTFRSKQYNYELAEFRPDRSADYAVETYNAVVACGQPCAAQAPVVLQQLPKLGVFFHTIYSTTLDERFYGPAKKIYEYYLSIPNQADTETVRTYLTRINETKKLAKDANGKHDKSIMDSATSLERPKALSGCYERSLQGTPALSGSVRVTIEVSPAGEATAVTTEPAAGEAGMAAVAGCIQNEIQTWNFPARTLDGTTRVSRTYSFSPAAPPPAAAPAAAEEDEAPAGE